MTKRHLADQPCIIPRDSAWVEETGWIKGVLESVAAAAYTAQTHTGDADQYVLPPLTYQVAADTLHDIYARISDEPARDGTSVLLLVVQGHELEALWSVLAVLRRARDGDGDAEELSRLVTDYVRESSRAFTDVISTLERVLTMLTLDIPAVRELATALLVKQGPSEELRQAYAQLCEVWRSVGISC
ncbi:hypothetical protein GTY41_38285 [Streptomyces sp. SID685]|uniref:hypothetical protein n=1 Tax=Streptomyces sp. SID685 TaxID=2690322 RepID=UPI00136E8781|nr:hypothetical protein [Streptomyces sp. SID685]MYR90612.1 hypothetical protein [Streptomyces sp. SID685]